MVDPMAYQENLFSSKMKRLLTIFLFCIVFYPSSAQKYEIGFCAGYSTFAMEDLKSDFARNIDNIPFESKLVSNFPPWLHFGGNGMLKFGFYSIGIRYTYISTGGKIATSDYSGKYTFEEFLSSHSVGLANSFRVVTLGKIQGEIRMTIGFIHSSIKVEEYLQVYENTLTNSASFYSQSLFAEPAVLITYSFPRFRVGADFAYCADRGAEIKTKSEEQTFRYTDWSGFRIGIHIGVFPDKLFKKKP
jgi:hypothetical protein